jgi:diguanylate cyclase (GGDEF)-like protein/PAS domain S-box-containing protein
LTRAADWRSLVENVGDLVVVVDEDGLLRYVSPSVQRVLGFEPGDILGRSMFEVTQFEDDAIYRTLLTDYAGGAEVDDLTGVRVRAADGSTRILEVIGANRLDDPGVRGIVLTARDVTDRHLGWEQMAASRAWAEALLQGGSELVVVTDEDTRVTYASPAVHDILGLVPEEAIGIVGLDLIHPDDVETGLEALARLVGPEREADAIVLRVIHADGEWRWLRINGRNLADVPTVGGLVLNISDVTDLVEARHQLERSEAWASTLVESGSDVVVVTDRHGYVTYVSPSVRGVLGYEPEQLIGSVSLDLIAEHDRGRARDDFEHAVLTGEETGPAEYLYHHAGGATRYLSATVTNLLASDAVRGMVLRGRDVTRRRHAERLLQHEAGLLRTIARGLPVEVALNQVARLFTEQIGGSACYLSVADADGVLRSRASDGAPPALIREVDAMPADSWLGRRLRSPGVREMLFRDIAGNEQRGPLGDLILEAGFAATWVFCITDAATAALLGTVAVLVPEDRDPTPVERDLAERAVNVAAIAIERAIVEAGLQHKAQHDDLTALPNRNLLMERVEQVLLRARRRLTVPAVLFLDLDRFKVVNDSRGHEVGDDLLRQVAARLAGPLRAGDTLGRLGGDEFVIVCEDVGGEEGARTIAHRLLDVFDAPFVLEGGDLFLSASIGVAVAVDADVAADLLVRDADVAMFRAKQQGRARIEVFEESLRTQTVRRLETEQALRLAVDRAELVLEYQPVVGLDDGVVVSLEALARWDRPGHGRVQPDAFIPVAEESGLIVAIGHWVLHEACRVAQSWPPNSTGELPGVSVNLSARQLNDPNLVDIVAAVLDVTGLDARRLCLEVTESVLVHDPDEAAKALAALRSLGVSLSIDDFGTGYASLEYLRRFSMADELKIDRSFVQGVATRGSQEAAIVSASIAMAASLDLRVVAEGVQTPDQIDALRTFGCDRAQGYHFSRPVPAEAVPELLTRTAPW